MKGLFDPSQLDSIEPTLSETVIRYEIDPDGSKTIKQKTIVVNDFGDDFQITAEGGEPEIGPVVTAQ